MSNKCFIKYPGTKHEKKFNHCDCRANSNYCKDGSECMKFTYNDGRSSWECY